MLPRKPCVCGHGKSFHLESVRPQSGQKGCFITNCPCKEFRPSVPCPACGFWNVKSCELVGHIYPIKNEKEYSESMEKTSLPAGVTFVSMSEVTRYVPGFTINVGNLERAKRGDWVRLLVKFPHRCDYCGKGCGMESKTEVEFISAKISGLNPASNLFKARILSYPEHGAQHGLAYDDDFTLAMNYVLDYVEQPTGPVVERTAKGEVIRTNYGTAAEEHLLTGEKPAAVPINAEDQKLRDVVKTLPPLAPVAGKRYWLRNGAVAVIWTQRDGKWIGKTEDGAEFEWNTAGAHASGNREFDIVRDLKEVLV